MNDLVGILKKEDRHTHDCDRCVYLGTSHSAANDIDGKTHGTFVQRDWYMCPHVTTANPTRDYPTLIVRTGSDGPDYGSVSLWPEAVESTMVREAFRLGLLEIASSPHTVTRVREHNGGAA